MRILLLTQIVPYPPDSGPRVKTYHVIRHLAECGHRVALATFVRAHEEQNIEHLKPYCAEIHTVPIHRSRVADVQALAVSFRTGIPFLVARDAKPEMFRTVRELVEHQAFDIVQADQLTMAQYALEFQNGDNRSQGVAGGAQDRGHRRRGVVKSEIENPKSKILFDAHNAVHKIMERSTETAPLPLRPFLAREARLVKEYEGMLVRTFDHTFAVSDQDKQALLEAAGPEGRAERPMSQMAHTSAVEGFKSAISNLQSKITVVPIAVDTDQLTPVHPITSPDPAGLAGQSPNILTLGTLYYPPNADGVRWFAQQVYPLVLEQVPAATLTIVGPRPPKDIVALATQPALSLSKGHSPLVTVPGYVPDLVPYLERAALMVVPVRAGSGMRVRILEAFARGIPVVTTTTGVEGIEAVDGEHLLVADEPAAFAEAVVRLLRDPQLGRRLVANGRRLAEEKYDWRAALPKLERVYEAVAG